MQLNDERTAPDTILLAGRSGWLVEGQCPGHDFVLEVVDMDGVRIDTILVTRA